MMSKYSMSGHPFKKQTHRICTLCKKDLSADNFYIRKTGRLYSECRDCSKKRQRKNVKRYNLAKYNLSLEDYYKLGEKQKWLCAICGKPETVMNQYGSRSLCADHNHKTNKPRGLLCSQCNHLLGNAKENVQILAKAIEYLEKYRT